MSYTLAAEPRTVSGKKVASVREEQKVPGILYGVGVDENKALQIPLQQFEKVYDQAGESQVVELKVNDDEPVHVLIKEVQIDPVTRNVLHADFQSIDINQPVEVEVPLEFEGEAPAVKSTGGTLMKPLSTLPIRCLPKNLVKHIQVPLAGLKTADDSILLEHLAIPEGIEVLREQDELIATVIPPRVEAAEEETEGEAAPQAGEAAEAPAEESKEA